MASSADIIKVQDAIEADQPGWDAVAIAARLDAGQSALRVIETYWRKRAQEYLLVVSTSESGSTRGNDVIYMRMIDQADRYAGLAEVEEALVAPASPTGRISSFKMRRV